MKRATSLIWTAMLGGLMVCASSSGACSDGKSSIMLAVTTDMKAPKDVNAVSVTVSTNNSIKHNVIGRVTPQGDILLPATLAIVEPDDPNASIRIRVMAFQERKARVLRDVRTSIPSGGRVALLRIPLNFVNDGSTQGDLPDNTLPAPNPGTATPTPGDGGSSAGGGGNAGAPTGGDLFDPFTFVPNCPNPEHTWIDGECKDAYIDPASLPDYDESQVGSGEQPGVCFDVRKCFATAMTIGAGEGARSGGAASDSPSPAPMFDAGVDEKDFRPQAITLDSASCTLALNGTDASTLNLALVTPDTGECIRPNECYVPIDSGPGGWRAEGGQVKLPSFVCKLITSKNLKLHQATGCAAKKESNPICLDKVPQAVTEGEAGVGQTDTPMRRVFAGNFPSAVLGAGSPTSFHVGFEGGVARLEISGGGGAAGAGVPGIPGTKRPWAFGPSSAHAGFVATNGGSTAYVLRNTTAEAFQLPGDARAVAGTFVLDGMFYFAATGANGGIFRGSESTTTKIAFNPRAINDATAIAMTSGTGFVYGTANGRFVACTSSNSNCGIENVVGASRVDGLAVVGTGALALLSDGLYRVQVVNAQSGTVESLRVVSDQAAGIQADGFYYPHGLTVDESCVYYTTAAGLSYATLTSGGASGGLVAPPPTGTTLLGVATADKTIYVTAFAPQDQGGGLYSVPAPPACRGGGAIAPDASAPVCLATGADCQSDAECCSGSCNVKCQPEQ